MCVVCCLGSEHIVCPQRISAPQESVVPHHEWREPSNLRSISALQHLAHHRLRRRASHASLAPIVVLFYPGSNGAHRNAAHNS